MIDRKNGEQAQQCSAEALAFIGLLFLFIGIQEMPIHPVRTLHEISTR